MYVLQSKETGEVIDPRTADFALSPSDLGHESWEDALAASTESDLIDGYAVVRLPNAITADDLASMSDDARRVVAAVAAGESVDLVDSESAEVIRPATEAEAVESAMAGAEGHILVNGRRCYVAL